MAKIDEAGGWVDTIPMIMRADRVEGGAGGTVNVQTSILAGRTKYLRDSVDAVAGMMQAGEQPYSSVEQARAAISAGVIADGSKFSVRSAESEVWVDEYVNQGGAPVKTDKQLPSLDALNRMRELISEKRQSSELFLFSDADGFHIADISIDGETGRPGLGLGEMGITRSADGVFEIVDRDGFVLSVGDELERARVMAMNAVPSGTENSRSADGVLEVIDRDGFVISIDDTLGRVLSLEKKLDAVREGSDIAARVEAAAQAAGQGLAERVYAPVATLRRGLNIFLFYGQSLAIGDQAYTVVTRRPSELGNLMLGQAPRGAYYGRTADRTFGVIGGKNVYYPLEEKRQDGHVIITDPGVSANMGETVASGFIETLKSLHNRRVNRKNDDEVTLACSVTGCVGTGIATLMRGASQGYYNRLIDCLNGHIEAAAAAGYTDVQVCGLVYLQGENDYSSMTRAAWRDSIAQLFDDFVSDVQRVTGQSDSPGLFIYQTGGHYVTGAQGNTMPVSMAQLDIADRPDVFMVAPVFPYPQAVAEMTHKSANGYRWWGCAAAHAVDKIYSSVNHMPFEMVSAEYDGKSVYVGFRVPCPPLTIRPFYEVGTPVIKNDLGFTVIDEIGQQYGDALNVEIASACVVKITPARALSGSMRVNLGDVLHRGGHNIADSSPQASIFSWEYYGDNNQPAAENIPSLNGMPYPLYNYAAIQTADIERE